MEYKNKFLTVVIAYLILGLLVYGGIYLYQAYKSPTGDTRSPATPPSFKGPTSEPSVEGPKTFPSVDMK